MLKRGEASDRCGLSQFDIDGSCWFLSHDGGLRLKKGRRPCLNSHPTCKHVEEQLRGMEMISTVARGKTDFCERLLSVKPAHVCAC